MLSLASLFTFGQDENLKIDAKIVEGRLNPIRKAEVIVLDESGTLLQKVPTNFNGRLKLTLDYNEFYVLQFVAEGFQTKVIEVNTMGVQTDCKTFGYEFGGFKITLIPDPTQEPMLVARINYNDACKNFDYEKVYSNSTE